MAKKNGKVTNPFSDDPFEDVQGGSGQVNTASLRQGGGWKVKHNGAELATDTLEGVIVYQHPLLQLYEGSFDGTGSAPDCMSVDGVNGHGAPGGACQTCQRKWSRDLQGAAYCKGGHALYLLDTSIGDVLLVRVPATSRATIVKFLREEGDPRMYYVALGTDNDGATKSRSGFTQVTIEKGAATTKSKTLIASIKEAREQFKGTERTLLPAGGSGQGAIPQAAGGDWK